MIRALAPVLLGTALLASPAPAADSVSGSFSGAGGSATVTAAPKGVLVKVQATGLTPGWHAIHFHEKGTCADAGAGFKASGAHVHDVTPAVHGLLNPAANDKGDLPNVFAAADGSVNAELFSPLVTLAQLKDADGSAVILHAKADDHQTQPIGGAGDRVACAVLK